MLCAAKSSFCSLLSKIDFFSMEQSRQLLLGWFRNLPRRSWWNHEHWLERPRTALEAVPGLEDGADTLSGISSFKVGYMVSLLSMTARFLSCLHVQFSGTAVNRATPGQLSRWKTLACLAQVVQAWCIWRGSSHYGTGPLQSLCLFTLQELTRPRQELLLQNPGVTWEVPSTVTIDH